MDTKKDIVDLSTEEKIIDAARKVFTQKGYAATRTRDIAEEANINLALLNYYFRSKEKLFHIVIMEQMQKFFGIIQPVFNDETTSLEYKFDKITENYTDVLLKNQDLSMFILSEIRNIPDEVLCVSNYRDTLMQSALIRQIKERKPELDPHHFLFNLLGMIIFPFLSSSIFKSGAYDKIDFENLIIERRKLIPEWLKKMI